MSPRQALRRVCSPRSGTSLGYSSGDPPAAARWGSIGRPTSSSSAQTARRRASHDMPEFGCVGGGGRALVYACQPGQARAPASPRRCKTARARPRRSSSICRVGVHRMRLPCASTTSAGSTSASAWARPPRNSVLNDSMCGKIKFCTARALEERGTERRLDLGQHASDSAVARLALRPTSARILVASTFPAGVSCVPATLPAAGPAAARPPPPAAASRRTRSAGPRAVSPP